MRVASRIVNGIGTWVSHRESGLVRSRGVLMKKVFKYFLPLGYGATTLPALTEAITIENNVTLANYEVIRLTERVDMIAATLRA